MYDTTKPYKREILNLTRETWETPYLSANGLIVRKKFPYPERHPHSDGIGTKGFYHWKQRTLLGAVIDSFAMNENDLAVDRATPYAITDHLIVPADDKEAILEIVRYLVYECRKKGIALLSGETSIQNNTDGLDISITMFGFIKKPKPNLFRVGDALIGLRSSGLHSNGFTKVREVFGKEYRQEFVEPTRRYLDAILDVDERFDIHGMVHITGGAYTRFKDLLYDADVRIRRDHKMQPQPIFMELFEHGVSEEGMYKTFNCGVGFVLSVDPKNADKLVSELDADVIGEVLAGTGEVKIESAFSNREISL